MSDDALIEAMVRAMFAASDAEHMTDDDVEFADTRAWWMKAAAAALAVVRADAQATVSTIWTDSDDVGTCGFCHADVANQDVESYSVVHWQPEAGHTLSAMYCADHVPHWCGG